MKVFISADIEGVTGLVSWSQCGGNNSKCYDFSFAREMMTHDVNAAIRGARQAGASEILVRDAHGNSKSLLVSQLEGPVTLCSGTGHSVIQGMMTGLDQSFDAAMLIGYHAKAGTKRAIMEHTLTGGIHRLKLNGIEYGEMGLSAFAAGDLGVPIVCVSSDQAGCDEAANLIEGTSTAVTKIPLSRYSGKLLDPAQTAARIEHAANRGVQNRGSIFPKKWKGECVLEVEYNRTEMTDNATKYHRLEQIDGYTLKGTYPSFEEAHRAIWNMLALESGGLSAHD